MAGEDRSLPSARDRLVRFVKQFAAEGELQEPASRHDPGSPSAPATRPSEPEDENGFPLPPTWPYPGLRAFTPREARLFFGRYREAGELRQHLADSNIVSVLGGSGSGKSSLVLAGVLPRLNDVGRIPGRQGRWYTVNFRPGDAPCRRLIDALWTDVCTPLLALKEGPRAFAEILGEDVTNAEAEAANGSPSLRGRFETIIQPDGKCTVQALISFLDKLDEVDERLADLRETARAGRINLLLVIDQFEELFRDTVKKERPEDIERIVELLSWTCEHRDDPLVVVITLRSEELHRCSEIDGLARVINTSFYLLDRPRFDALETATVQPGRQTLEYWSVKFEDDKAATGNVEKIAEQETGPFSPAFIRSLNGWVRDFQTEEFTAVTSIERRKRQQSDLLPLFQHLLRVSWSAAVARWDKEQPKLATVEVSDIESWIEARRGRVEELRAWLRANQKGGVPYDAPPLGNMLERCFDIGFAITLSEAVIGKPWTELKNWISDDASMVGRLRLIVAAFVALATRDDKGNDARRPASAGEIAKASHQNVNEDTVRNALSFFKNRNYLQGGDNGERYDVSHEALIRNSSEYQAWLVDAKNVADALARAHAALAAGGNERSDKNSQRTRPSFIVRMLAAIRKAGNVYFLKDLREAGSRFSVTTCLDLERVFGPDAVFNAGWMAERAQLGKTPEEQAQAVGRIERTWIKAFRWHLNIGAARAKGERPYFGIDLIRAVQFLFTRPSLRQPVTGRQVSYLRGVLPLPLFIVILLIFAVNYGNTVSDRIATRLNYAKTSGDLRLRSLLLVSALRDTNDWLDPFMARRTVNDLKEAIRDTLVRAPTFFGTFTAAEWDAQGRRVLTVKSKSKGEPLIVHDVVTNEEKVVSSYPAEALGPTFAPAASVGFAKSGDGGERIVAFQSATGELFVGKEGSELASALVLSPDPGEFINRADIFGDRVRVIFLRFVKGAAQEMAVIDLSPWLDRPPPTGDLGEKRLDWKAVEYRAARPPVLAEDCDDYAFLGWPQTEAEQKLSSVLWLGRLDNQPAKRVEFAGSFEVGQVAFARGCEHVVARDDEALHFFVRENPNQKVYSVPVNSLGELSKFVSAPGPVQPIFAAAPIPGGWRVGWLTEQGLAIVNVARDKPVPSTQLPSGAYLTGLDVLYQVGWLSFSPDGSYALLMRQKTLLSPLDVRAFNLNFEERGRAVAAETKTKDDLIAKACQIAELSGGSQLREVELSTWFGRKDAPQPCQPITPTAR